ncbi:Ig-like domain-containing protein, partial [Gilvimarinus sp. 1_MG-2023]
GNVSDNESVSTVTVLLNGDHVVATLDNDSFSVDLTLTDGDNELEITVTDAAGNTTSDTRTLILDTQAPELSFVFPSNGHATQALTTT